MARPSPAVVQAARRLLHYVRAEMKRGMNTEEFFGAERPARLHDELQMFLAVHDSVDPRMKTRRLRG